MDDLGSEVRKLRSDKRSLDSQFNEVKANYKAALAEVNFCVKLTMHICIILYYSHTSS